MDPRRQVQLVTLVFALIGILTWYALGRRYREIGLYAVAPLLWLLHVAIFYGAVFLIDPVPGNTLFTNWSAGVRLHGVFSLVAIGATLLMDKLGK